LFLEKIDENENEVDVNILFNLYYPIDEKVKFSTINNNNSNYLIMEILENPTRKYILK
jgi:hypothetical protein